MTNFVFEIIYVAGSFWPITLGFLIFLTVVSTQSFGLKKTLMFLGILILIAILFTLYSIASAPAGHKQFL